jgi:glycerol transport system ATP-binding protein
MARIDFDGVGHRYGDPGTPWALQPLTMTWEDAGAYALLGPSGCGKTTLLKLISGLLSPTEGRLRFDGRDVTTLDPRARNIAQVFQFPVLYDTMTVYDNLAFPLRNRGWAEDRVRVRVHEVAQLLELGGDLATRAHGLPADAQQRISLGRGLVRTDVAVVLLDEPLTVIDPHVKWLLRRKLKEVHEQLKVTLIYVTHDQVEALTFADRVVVMDAGAVLQVGTPEALYAAPEHTFVGHFIGSPGMNLVPCVPDGTAVRVGGERIELEAAVVDAAALALAAPALAAPAGATTGGSRCTLGFRPDAASLVTDTGAGSLGMSLRSVQQVGTHTLLGAELGGCPVWLRAPAGVHPAGAQLRVRVPAASLVLFVDGRRVGPGRPRSAALA